MADRQSESHKQRGANKSVNRIQKPAQPANLESHSQVAQRASRSPHSITPSDLGPLQQTVGNRAASRLLVQRKLVVGQSGDRFEQQADAVARQVTETPSVSGSLLEGSQLPSVITIQAKSDSAFQVDSDTETQISQAKSGGQSISDSVRAPLEQSFGADFGAVKLHTDNQADSLNRSLNARAFTTGNDIFFRSGEYKPESQSGKALLAHELTHTV